jgi:hypothetical protein
MASEHSECATSGAKVCHFILEMRQNAKKGRRRPWHAYRALAELPMVGPERARRLIEHRPSNSWEDVERVPGFDQGMIDNLRSGGAQIGGKRH